MKNVPEERIVPIPVSEYVYWSLDPLDAWDPNSLVRNFLWFEECSSCQRILHIFFFSYRTFSPDLFLESFEN